MSGRLVPQGFLWSPDVWMAFRFVRFLSFRFVRRTGSKGFFLNLRDFSTYNQIYLLSVFIAIHCCKIMRMGASRKPFLKFDYSHINSFWSKYTIFNYFLFLCFKFQSKNARDYAVSFVCSLPFINIILDPFPHWISCHYNE